MTPDRSLIGSPPHRVQLRRTKGWKMPANTVSVARPTKWGNPYRVNKAEWETPVVAAAEAVDDYRAWLWRKHNGPESRINRAPTVEAIQALRGKNLACWCPLDQPCHADVLLELANA